ncbi:TAXI family TRAP transporter solute-binding subunit [Sulfuritalea hydrogenivorans]|uniref:TRAP transporter solute receptor TAXI family protein n=1 Tax=Sulfuritalea hydrogenivorans sk43H TaxID=1223802 RepID=W0SJ34_9PROT|nr:TAXI family TRAP transporter solute-binding subunit [Sulfuritalea hydrogenivorans]BAO30691.1 TRAP transporter solute receptor TAXI family protein [Sulfuritalea hydrogenivorans sk43H]
MPEKLKLLSWRDIVFVALPSLLLVIGAFWLAAQFIKPAPPDRLVVSTGGEGGAYQRFAARYKDVLARYGIALVEKPSAGSTENLERLRNPEFEVDAAFIQGGTARPGEEDELVSLGDIYYEPLWIFYREAALRGSDKLLDLKGKRVAVGGAGSGTHYLAMELLAANGIDAKNTKLVEAGGLGLVERLQRNELDAVFVVGPTQSSLVWALLYTPGVRLMSLTHADAYTRRFPYLARLVLPRGAIDLTLDIPPHDTQLVSPMATLLVREGMHPALIDLLMQAASEVHGAPGVFQKPGEFPRAGHTEFPLSKEAERYYKSGKPFLQRYLPFWAATLIDRMVVMLVPLLAVLVPLFKFAPQIYGWRVRSRIYRRYGELKFLENELNENPDRHSRAEWLAKLDGIETDASRIRTPLTFSDMLYTLRGHIDLVREMIIRRTASADS